MLNSIGRWSRLLRALVLAGWLFAGPATTVHAQPQPEATAEGEGEESEGRPLDGYLLMVMLASLAFMVVGKTARR
jgi:hypothetical protein